MRSSWMLYPSHVRECIGNGQLVNSLLWNQPGSVCWTIGGKILEDIHHGELIILASMQHIHCHSIFAIGFLNGCKGDITCAKKKNEMNEKSIKRQVPKMDVYIYQHRLMAAQEPEWSEMRLPRT
jgi:hypothetical protein